MNRFKDWKPPRIDNDGWAWNNEFLFPFAKKYGWRCQYPDGLKLGKYVDVGCFTYMNAKYGIEIGENTQIGAHCAIYSDNTENETHGLVKIGANCLIGSYTLILPNVTIPDNTKIRARSILK